MALPVYRQENDGALLFPQVHGALCSSSFFRSSAHSDFGILMSLEEYISRADEAFRKRNPNYTKRRSPSMSRGVGPLDIHNVAKTVGLGLFTKAHADLENLDYVLNTLKVFAGIHMPSYVDGGSHYVTLYRFDESVHIFDSYNPNANHKEGQRLIKTPEEFYNDWLFPQFDNERAMMFMYKLSERPKLPFRGRFL